MSGAAYRAKYGGVRSVQAAAATVAFDRSQLAQDKRRLQAAARRSGMASMRSNPYPNAAAQGAYMQRIGAPPFLPAQVPRGFVGQAGEAKYVDIANTTYALNTTGSINHISIVPQGTTVTSRVGRKCELKYLQVRGAFLTKSTTTFAAYAAYIVWDQQPNKTLPAITDVLDAANAAALPKRENVQRFRILRKWSGVFMGNSTTPSTGAEAVRIDEYFRLPKGLVIIPTTADTTGGIGDIITGALYLITVGDLAAGTADGNMNVTMRLGFSDIY